MLERRTEKVDAEVRAPRHDDGVRQWLRAAEDPLAALPLPRRGRPPAAAPDVVRVERHGRVPAFHHRKLRGLLEPCARVEADAPRAVDRQRAPLEHCGRVEGEAVAADARGAVCRIAAAGGEEQQGGCESHHHLVPTRQLIKICKLWLQAAHYLLAALSALSPAHFLQTFAR